MDHVINWVWQGALVAAMTATVLRLMERTRAHARFLVCWLALAAIATLPLLSAGLREARRRQSRRRRTAPRHAGRDDAGHLVDVVVSGPGRWRSVVPVGDRPGRCGHPAALDARASAAARSRRISNRSCGAGPRCGPAAGARTWRCRRMWGPRPCSASDDRSSRWRRHCSPGSRPTKSIASSSTNGLTCSGGTISAGSRTRSFA